MKYSSKTYFYKNGNPRNPQFLWLFKLLSEQRENNWDSYQILSYYDVTEIFQTRPLHYLLLAVHYFIFQ